MFTAALFTTAKIWKPPKCALTDKWIKKIPYVCIYLYIGILLDHKKERNLHIMLSQLFLPIDPLVDGVRKGWALDSISKRSAWLEYSDNALYSLWNT